MEYRDPVSGSRVPPAGQSVEMPSSKMQNCMKDSIINPQRRDGMNIYDAMKARTADRPFITRQAWRNDYGPWAVYGVRVLPTNTPDGCLIQSRASTKMPIPRWQPTAADLVADDWMITD